MSIQQWYRRTRCHRPSLGIFKGILGHVFIHTSPGVDDCLCGMQRMCHGLLECRGAYIAYLSEQMIRMSEDEDTMLKYDA